MNDLNNRKALLPILAGFFVMLVCVGYLFLLGLFAGRARTNTFAGRNDRIRHSGAHFAILLKDIGVDISKGNKLGGKIVFQK